MFLAAATDYFPQLFWVFTNANGIGGDPEWVELAPDGAPPSPRYDQVAVYDPTTNRMVVYGRTDNSITFGDTWVLTNANDTGGDTPAWILLSPSGTLPTSRNQLGATYSVSTNRLSIFAGDNAPICCNLLNDVWVLPDANGIAQTPGTWTATGSMSIGRQAYFTATLLTNGKVLVAGGSDGAAIVSSAELYDSSTGTWTPTASMSTARGGHTATLLPDGKVLVAGGQNSTTVHSTAELYDPVTGLWTLTGNMNVPRSLHMGTLITGGPLSGMVIIAAGSSDGGGGSNNLVSAELYDPSTGLWTYTGDMAVAQIF